MRPQARERCRTIHVGGRTVSLERVDADLAGRMHVVSRLGVKRRHVTGRHFPEPLKTALPRSNAALSYDPAAAFGAEWELIECSAASLAVVLSGVLRVFPEPLFAATGY